MMLKLERDQIAAEISALDMLLSSLPDNDFLGRISLEARRRRLHEEFGRLAHAEERKAKVALYFGGDPVIGNLGVQASFGTRAVGSFQDLLTKVWGMAEGGQLQSMGPIRDKAAAQMHITSLVHGSFGFLLEELDEEGEPLFNTPLSKAADQATDYIASFASENEARYSDVIETLNSRVFQGIRDFISCIHKNNATLRLVEGEREEKFDRQAVERAWERVEASNVDEDEIRVEGKLLGVIPVGRRFEFDPDGGTSIVKGKVGQKFGESYLQRMSEQQFAGRRWRAVMNRRIITKAGRQPYESFTLLELDEIESPTP
jgi:hypothetical protein